jgi:hypothetical protein
MNSSQIQDFISYSNDYRSGNCKAASKTLSLTKKMNTKSKLQAISDYLHYVALYAPNFPAEDRTDLKKSFEQIFKSIKDVLPLLKNENEKKWVELSLQEMNESYQKYISGQTDFAEKSLRIAIEHFDNAITRKTRKARFAVDSSGVTGEFTKKDPN